MKSKRLVVFLVVLIFLTVLIILNSTLFTLQTVNINWLTTKSQMTQYKDNELISKVKKGKSIFLVDKDEIKNKLEKEYEYLRVVSIETKFPNKIVIHSAERKSMFAIYLGEDEYAVIDELGKVLSLSDSGIFAVPEIAPKPIKVHLGEVYDANPSDYVKGEMVKNPAITNILSQIANSLRESNYEPDNSKGVFTDITFSRTDENGEMEMRLSTRRKINIVIRDFMNHTTAKFLMGINRYNYFHQEGVIKGSVIVWFDESLNTPKAMFEN